MNSLRLIFALFLTVIIEGTVMLTLTRSKEWVKFNLYVNLVTNPVMNLSFKLIFFCFGNSFKVPMYICGEVIVILLETVFYKLMSHENIRRCFWLSAATNTVSVFLGSLILH